MHTLTHLRWRSVRIFARNPALPSQWSLALLGLFVKPFATQFPETPFFMSRYGSEDGVGPGKDPASVPLPADCLVQSGGKSYHFSIRFRFVSGGPEETYVLGLLAQHAGLVFPEPMDDYKPMEFAEHRAFAAFNPALPADPVRAERAHIVGQFLWWNARLVLHALQQTAAGGWQYEVNGNNGVLAQSSFWYAMHMTKNFYGETNGNQFHCYLANQPLTAQQQGSIAGVTLRLI